MREPKVRGWIFDLIQMPDVGFVRDALSEVDGSPFEPVDGWRVIAAAELVSALLGRTDAALPDRVQEWVEAQQATVSSELRRLAADGVQRLIQEGFGESPADDNREASEFLPMALRGLLRRLS